MKGLKIELDTEFGGESLKYPPIWDITKPENLVLAIRPRGAASSMIDLSQSASSFQKKGSPSFTAAALVGALNDGYISGVTETTSVTYLATFRVTNTVDFVNSVELPIVGTWGNRAGSTDDQGTTLTILISVVGGSVSLVPRMRVFDGDGTLISASNIAALETFPITQLESSVFTVALIIDAEIDRYQLMYATHTVNSLRSSGAVGNRSRSRADGTQIKYEVATCPVLGITQNVTTEKVEILESLIYNTALTNTEIAKQKTLTSAGFAKLGIMVT